VDNVTFFHFFAVFRPSPLKLFFVFFYSFHVSLPSELDTHYLPRVLGLCSWVLLSVPGFSDQ